MKRLIAALTLLVLLLSACQDISTVTFAPNPFSITPSRPPTILTLTPVLAQPTISATLTATSSITPSSTDSSPSVTAEASTTTPTLDEPFTPSPTLPVPFTSSPTITNTPQIPAIQLIGCETGLDLNHGMGEVTNAYVTLINATGPDLTSVCATLSSADEGRLHPDKTICIPSLPAGYLIKLKLTIDTTFQVNTMVEFSITSNEGIPIATDALVCGAVGIHKPHLEILNVLQPIK